MFCDKYRAASQRGLFLLGCSVAALASWPAMAATYNVGGGTIVTTQADNSTDLTGSGDAFILQPNTVSSGDTVTVTGVTFTNTASGFGANGRALDFGYTLPATGSYSVVMHGNNLTGNGNTAILAESTSGNVSLDTTGGAANFFGGMYGIILAAPTGNGSMSLNMGADTINVSSEAVQVVTGGAGTITIDAAAGASLTAGGTYGVVAQVVGTGNLTIGGQNGGFAGSISAVNGYGIYANTNGTESITLASTGSINAATGIRVLGGTAIIDSFGSITGTTAAIDTSYVNSSTASITLESGSVTSGAVIGTSGNDTLTINSGANITNATFDGGAGTDTLVLTGSGSRSFALSKATNIEAFEKDGNGTWTVTGTVPALSSWTVNAGTLQMGSGALFASSTVTINGGTLDLANQSMSVNDLTGTGGTVNLGSGTLTVYGGTLASTVTGTGGSLYKVGASTLTLTGTNTYTGGTVINTGGLVNFATGANLGTGNITLSGGGLQWATGNTTDISSRLNALGVNGGTFDTNGNNVTLASVITGGGPGSGSLNKAGAGTLILTAANTYTGGTLISAGTLQIGNGGTTGSISGDVIDNSILVFDRSDTVTYAGYVSPNGVGATGSLVQAGTGTLILTGLDAATNTTINNGSTLQLGNGGTAGALSGNVTDNGALIFDRTDTTTTGGNITGSGSVTIAGTGNMALSGVNTYNGATTIAAGTLTAVSATALSPNSAMTVASGATLDLFGFSNVIGSLAGSGTVTNSSSNPVPAILTAGGNNSSTAFSGVIAGPLALKKVGNGTLILTGNNTYTGSTTVSAGTLQIGNGGTSGTLPGVLVDNSVVVFDRSDPVSLPMFSGTGSLIQAGSGTLTLTGVVNSFSGLIAVNAGTLVANTPGLLGTGSVALNGGTLQVGISGVVSNNIVIGSSNGAIAAAPSTTLAGSVTGTGNLTVAGTGKLILTGVDSYGGTTINSGSTLQIGNGGTIGSIAGNVLDNGVLIFDRSDAVTFPGVISGAGSIIDIGTGDLTLSSANSYSGGTTLNSGTLHVAVNGALGSGDIALNGGALIFDNGGSPFTVASNVKLGPGGHITANGAVTISGVISDAGAPSSIEFDGSGQVTLNHTNSYTGATTIFASVTAGAVNVLGNGSAVSLDSTFDMNGFNQSLGSLASTGADGLVTNSGGAAVTLTVGGNNGTTYDGNIIQDGSGTIALVKTGTGNLYLYNASTYTGGTTINGGALTLYAMGGTQGSLSGNIIDNGLLAFARTLNYSFAGNISGSGAIANNTGIITTLSGNNNYTGATTVSLGTLKAGSTTAFGSNSATTVASGATLDLGGFSNAVGSLSGAGTVTSSNAGAVTFTAGGDNTSTTFSGVIQDGAGVLSLVKTGSGKLTLTGANTYTGTTTISGGTLSVNGSLAGAVTVTGSGTLGGNGTVHGLTVASGASLAPGNSIGTVNVSGNLTLSSGSTYVVEVSSAASDQTLVTGTATITGASLQFSPLGGAYTQHTYTLLTANGGLTGTFASVNYGSGFPSVFTPTVSYDANDVYLTLIANSFVWSASPASSDWNNMANWSANTVPLANSQVQFGASSAPSVTIASAAVAQSLQFNASAPSYTIAVNGTASGAASLTLSNGITDNSGKAQTISVGGVSGHAGSLAFTGSGTAADTVLVANSFGTISFAGSTDAGVTASLTANSGGGIDFSATSGTGGNHQVNAGSIAGAGTIALGANTLTTGALGSSSFAGVISGSGGLVKTGTGTLTLGGANTYAGGTSVNAGVLAVNGTIGAVSVASGATLTGNGKAGATTIASGATLNPGGVGSVGTLTVGGNLALASGATYVSDLSAAGTDLTQVNGTASVNGALQVVVASGSYVPGTRYTLINATGGLSGSFASSGFVSLPAYLKGGVTYDANDVFVTLSANALTPLLPTSATAGEKSVAAAIDASILKGNAPNSGIISLFTLPATGLTGALDQLQSAGTPNIGVALSRGFLDFLDVAPGDDAVGSYAPGQAYDAPGAPSKAQLGTGVVRVWGGVEGGHAWQSADASTGAAKYSASHVGFSGGADMRVNDGTLIGADAAFGSQTMHSAGSTGDSTDWALGLYAHQAVGGQGYLAASFAYGGHAIDAKRTLTISGTDVLEAKPNADEYGGRIEGGWRMPMGDFALVPFAAFAGSHLSMPAFSETAISGSSNFALSYAAMGTSLLHTELGATGEQDYGWSDDATLHARLRAAWAHELNGAPSVTASFLGLPGASFQIQGARPIADALQLGLDLDVVSKSGLSYGVNVKDETGSSGGAVAAGAHLGWAW
jgi:autotransporter-associated beta strand protein